MNLQKVKLDIPATALRCLAWPSSSPSQTEPITPFSLSLVFLGGIMMGELSAAPLQGRKIKAPVLQSCQT